MIEKIAEKIMNGEYLNYAELKDFVDNIRSGNINSLQFVSILAAMESRNRINGINPDESANFVRALRLPQTHHLEGVLCNAGTGGDKVKTINVGTTSMPILAEAGINVLKIGYKGITSKCGSRDILQALGLNPFLSIDKVIESVKQVKMGYYDFANLIIIEDRSGFRSPLHYLAPLCHPLNLTYKIMGCSNKKHLEIVKPILERLCENYLLTFNPDIDEISPLTPTIIVEKRNGARSEYEFNPLELNLLCRDYRDIGSSEVPEKSAMIIREIYEGKRSPKSEFIAINAGAGLYLSGNVCSIAEGFSLALEILKSRKALERFNSWARFQGKNEA